MRKEGAGRGKEMASKVAKPVVLSAEAMAMEQKLAELRKAMEKERAKRDALMANAGGGSIWRNGGSQGGLKPKGKSSADPGHAGGASSTSASASSSSARRPASGDAAPSGRSQARHSQPGSGAGAAGSASGVSASAASASGSNRSLSARGLGAGGAAVGEAAMPTVSGSRLTTTKPAAASGKADILVVQAGGGGMSCGTDDGPSLASGAFNEADSHRSFLEALNEWRKAQRGDAPADGAAQGTSTSTGTAAATSSGRPRSAAAVESASLEVQTEVRPAAQRPSSAKPLSYFDKLVINTSSRQAGHLAAGEPPETLRKSLTGQPSATFRPTSATRKSTDPAGDEAATPAAAKAGAVPPDEAASEEDQVEEKTDGKPDPLSILDRLEALERQQQARSQAEEEDDDGGGGISVTTAHGMVLTKGVRLPDEVLLPGSEVC